LSEGTRKRKHRFVEVRTKAARREDEGAMRCSERSAKGWGESTIHRIPRGRRKGREKKNIPKRTVRNQNWKRKRGGNKIKGKRGGSIK